MAGAVGRPHSIHLRTFRSWGAMDPVGLKIRG
jgi:hypothetical protein